MANLPSTPEWVEGVYRIERSDPVLGANPLDAADIGIANLQAAALAKRTAWLKARYDETQFTANFEVTVGPGGDHATLNEAVARLAPMSPGFDEAGAAYTATIRLLTGFVMAEQLIVRGRNLAWASIVSDDATVVIDRAALTVDVEGGYPAFFAGNGGALPVIDALFVMNTSGTATSRWGAAAGSGGSATIKAGRGIQQAGWFGVVGLQGGTVTAEGADFRNAAQNAVRATRGASIAVQSANLSGAGHTGVFCHKTAAVDCQGADITGAATYGIYCATGGRVDASSANARKGASDSTSDIYVLNGGWIAAGSATGGTNVTVNTITASGVICR